MQSVSVRVSQDAQVARRHIIERSGSGGFVRRDRATLTSSWSMQIVPLLPATSSFKRYRRTMAPT